MSSAPSPSRAVPAGWLVALLVVSAAMLCHALVAGTHSSAHGAVVSHASHHGAVSASATEAMPVDGPSVGPADSPAPAHPMTLLAFALTTMLLLALTGRRVPRRLGALAAVDRGPMPRHASRAPPLVLFPSLFCVLRT